MIFSITLTEEIRRAAAAAAAHRSPIVEIIRNVFGR